MESLFIQRLEKLAKSNKNRSLNKLITTFEDKSFAVLFLLFMAIPALPIPTGGVTHIFELIVMLLALEMIIGRHTIWLPKRWSNAKLPDKFWAATLPALIRLIKRLERFTRRRFVNALSYPMTQRLIGIIVLLFALFAFLAPPFSGLDTLPSLGIVLIALSLLFEDSLLLLIGFIVGCTGIGLVIFLGKAVFTLI